jgi:hypothetical protein
MAYAPTAHRSAGAAAAVAALLLAGCALTPVNYQGTDSGRYDDGRTWHYSGGKFADRKDGKGVMAWSDGDRFEGEWVAYEGPKRGTMTYRDGNVYTGQVAPNFDPHGKGRKVWKDGGCSYEGDWADGRQHGEGVYQCPTGFTRTGSYRRGKAHGRSVTVWPDGQRYEGSYSDGRREDPAATIRFASGNEYKGAFVDDQRDGVGWYSNAAEGQAYRQFYRADTLMASIPIGASAATCAAVPAGWLLAKGACTSAGLDGDIVLAAPDGLKRFVATYRGGVPSGVAEHDELTASQAVKTKGTARGPGDFTSGQQFVAVANGDKKGVWQHVFDGSLQGVAAVKGRCLFRGQWESCEYAQGRRVDALHLDRVAAEEAERRAREAERRREEAEERARSRAEAEERAAQRRADEAESRAAMQQAIAGGLANLQQNMAQLREQDRRTAQLIAQANRERADREAQRQADARRERERAEAEREEARRRQAAVAQRSQQAAQQAQQAQQAAQAQQLAQAQQATQQRQEAERREQARREQEAAARREQEQRQAAEAERKRKEEERAAQARAEAERQKAEAERRQAEAERKRAEEAERKRAEEAARKQALAFCWQSDKGYWNCDGRVQETLIGEKGDKGLDEQLGLVGCKQPRRLTTGEITLTSTRGKQRSGHVYDCGYKLDAGDTGGATWNRDIRRWWRDIPW